MDIKKALIVQPGLIGDGLLTLPLAHLLRDELDFEEFALCCPAAYGGFLEKNSIFARVYDFMRMEFDRLHSRHLFLSLNPRDRILEMFEAYDLVVFFVFDQASRFSDNVSEAMRLADVKQFYLLKWTPPDAWKDHVLDWHVHQLRRGGLACSNHVKDWKLDTMIVPGDELVNYGHLRARRHGHDLRGRYVTLVPGSGVQWKQVHIHNWLHIAERLCESNLQVLWLAGPAEAKTLLPGYRNEMAVYGTIVETGDLAYSTYLLYAGFATIANDCAMSHLSAGLGIPTLTLFGPTQAEWYKPCGPSSETLQLDPKAFKGLHEESICQTMKSFYKLSSVSPRP